MKLERNINPSIRKVRGFCSLSVAEIHVCYKRKFTFFVRGIFLFIMQENAVNILLEFKDKILLFIVLDSTVL